MLRLRTPDCMLRVYNTHKSIVSKKGSNVYIFVFLCTFESTLNKEL